MLVFDNFEYSSPSPCVVALGCFDGVHRGHTCVLNIARNKADELCLPLCVFAFSEPPRNFFSPASVPLLTSYEEKLELFESLGVDIAVCVPFDEKILSVQALNFVNNILIDNMKAAHIVCGYNYTFGKNAVGNSEMIQKICKEKNIGVTVTPDFVINGASVSSSLIRNIVSDGDMETAALLLGRPYSISEAVVGGQHLARKLGFPTVNIIPSQGKLTPKNGVYVSRVIFDGQKKYGITNIGMRPTVDTHIMCAETHIFDFDGDLYGKKITVEFLSFLREETKFPSVEQLAKQVEIDIEAAKKYIQQISCVL